MFFSESGMKNSGKVEQRRARDREAAKRSRKRKKELVEYLTEEVRRLTLENEALRSRVVNHENTPSRPVAGLIGYPKCSVEPVDDVQDAVNDLVSKVPMLPPMPDCVSIPRTILSLQPMMNSAEYTIAKLWAVSTRCQYDKSHRPDAQGPGVIPKLEWSDDVREMMEKMHFEVAMAPTFRDRLWAVVESRHENISRLIELTKTVRAMVMDLDRIGKQYEAEEKIVHEAIGSVVCALPEQCRNLFSNFVRKNQNALLWMALGRGTTVTANSMRTPSMTMQDSTPTQPQSQEAAKRGSSEMLIQLLKERQMQRVPRPLVPAPNPNPHQSLPQGPFTPPPAPTSAPAPSVPMQASQPQPGPFTAPLEPLKALYDPMALEQALLMHSAAQAAANQMYLQSLDPLASLPFAQKQELSAAAAAMASLAGLSALGQAPWLAGLGMSLPPGTGSVQQSMMADDPNFAAALWAAAALQQPMALHSAPVSTAGTPQPEHQSLVSSPHSSMAMESPAPSSDAGSYSAWSAASPPAPSQPAPAVSVEQSRFFGTIQVKVDEQLRLRESPLVSMDSLVMSPPSTSPPQDFYYAQGAGADVAAHEEVLSPGRGNSDLTLDFLIMDESDVDAGIAPEPLATGEPAFTAADVSGIEASDGFRSSLSDGMVGGANGEQPDPSLAYIDLATWLEESIVSS